MRIGDELEEITEANFEIFNDDIVNIEIDTSQVSNLDIVKEIDLKLQIFNIE